MKNKNYKKIAMFAVLAGGLFFTSCTASHTAVITNNPVGSKTGVSESKLFSQTTGFSYHDAVKKGGISKVGIAESKIRFFIVPTRYTLTVTGD